MPQITGITSEDTNATFTRYSGNANETKQTFTFSKTQDGMSFFNEGNSVIELTVEGEAHNVPPRSRIQIDDITFTSFDARAKKGTSNFTLTSFSLKGSKGGDIDPAILDDINAQLAQKPSKEEVRKETITNPITLSELHTEVKTAMTGGSVPVVGVDAVGTENLKTKSVNEKKVSFFSRGKNLLDYLSVKETTYVSDVDGSEKFHVTNYANFRATDFISVTPETSYVINKKVNSAIFYDSNKTYLSAYYKPGYNPKRIEAGEPFTTPVNAAFMRVNLQSADNPKETQIEQGTAVTEFEPYYIPPVHIPNKSVELGKLKEEVTTKKEFNDFKNNVSLTGGGNNQPINVSFPNNFGRWNLLETCTNASKWSYDGTNSTSLGTVSEVTEVDTTNIPSSFTLTEQMKKPWLFSERGSMQGVGDAFGNKMLKFEVEPNGEAYFHTNLVQREDFSANGEIAFAIWMDTSSPDVKAGVVQPMVYHNYPTVLTDFHRAVDVSTGMVDGKGDWLLVSVPTMRKSSNPQLWKQFGAAPYGISTLATVDGIGFRVVNSSTDKKVRFYISGIYRINNTLDRGKLILDFDDGFLSQYQNGFRYMYDTYGYKGNMGIVGSWVEQGYHGAFSPNEYPIVSKEQIIEMQSAGWDITSHTWSHQMLGYSGDTPDKPYNEIQKNYQWLSDVGVTKGKRFLIYPEGNWGRWLPDVARKFHVMGRGAGMYMQINPTIRQFHYPGLDAAGWTESAWRSTLQTIQDHKGVAVRLFHHIGTGAYNPCDPVKFRAFIDAIQEYDIDVITWSEFYDNYVVPESL